MTDKNWATAAVTASPGLGTPAEPQSAGLVQPGGVGASGPYPHLVYDHPDIAVDIDIDGICLSTATLRAALVETLTERFNVARVAISQGEPRAGQAH